MSADNPPVARHTWLPKSIKRRLVQLRTAYRVQMARKDLTRLSSLYNTDKGWVHGYMTHYATHLSGRRWERLNFLEIGIGGGGSLKMWHTYFRNATIYGMDLHARDSTGPRLRIMQGDQGDTEQLLRVANTIGTIDVLIDDGSHINAHVRSTFETLFPYVAAGGYYIIEDLHTAYFSEFGGHPPGTGTSETSIGLIKELLDGLHHRHYRLPDYVPAYTDENVAALHVYEISARSPGSPTSDAQAMAGRELRFLSGPARLAERVSDAAYSGAGRRTTNHAAPTPHASASANAASERLGWSPM